MDRDGRQERPVFKAFDDYVCIGVLCGEPEVAAFRTFLVAEVLFYLILLCGSLDVPPRGFLKGQCRANVGGDVENDDEIGLRNFEYIVLDVRDPLDILLSRVLVSYFPPLMCGV